MIAGWLLAARIKLIALGTATVAAGTLFTFAAPGVRIPVPLNSVGATAATTAIVAYLATLPWAVGAARDVPELEHAHRRRAAGIRAACAAVPALVLAVVGMLGAAAPALARLATQGAFFFGLALVFSGMAAGMARWLPGFGVLTVSLVLGVNRSALEPYGIAWLLRDATDISAVGDVLPALLLVVGACVVALRAPTERSLDQ